MMSESSRPSVAAFRPDDGRADEAAALLEELGAEPVIDPMLELVPTGNLPGTVADIVVLTSPAAATILTEAAWNPGEVTLCAIGERTASTLREAGYDVDVVPDEYTSSGMVEALADRAPGRRIDVARSDHGSPVLLDGLREAGATVEETILYELRRPDGAGWSAERLVAGELDAVLFTSALTVEHFLESAADRGIEPGVNDALDAVVVAAIGEPTRRAAEARGIGVDVVPDRVSFEELAVATLTHLAGRHVNHNG